MEELLALIEEYKKISALRKICAEKMSPLLSQIEEQIPAISLEILNDEILVTVKTSKLSGQHNYGKPRFIDFLTLVDSVKNLIVNPTES